MPGRLIIFEGTDGSGKSTQFKLACQALEERGTAFRSMVFPRYQEESSALVRLYLGGAFGSHPSDVGPCAASTFFAVDRYAGYKQDWGKWYEGGGLMVSDRYTTSNAVHQASKLPAGEREEFFRWLFDFEYHRLELPRPDLVVWLDMPIDLAVENLRHREAATHTHGDIHEVDSGYLRACCEAAAQAAAFCSWRRVCCADGAGKIRPVEDIHREVMALIDGALDVK